MYVNARSLSNARLQRGISMLESLLTIFILAFGLFGLVGLQAKMQSSDMDTYARSQALVLLDDMAARLSVHRSVAATYVTTAPAGTGDAQPADCSGTALGQARDVCEWSNSLKGSAELAGSSAVGAMIGGRGCIEAIAGSDPPTYRIIVVWQGLSATVEPIVDCGRSLYGSVAGWRRVVIKDVAFANLGP
jgi:type IV pilus assembly protein PilV